MAEELVPVRQAAQRLGIRPATLYGWLAHSDAGTFVLRGQPVTIRYFQTGPKGQGRILVPAPELDRLLDRMRVTVHPPLPRRPPVRPASYPGITVPLGRPERLPE